MPGVGTNPFGTSGSIGPSSADPSVTSLGPFDFSVEALSTGSALRVSLTIPELTASPDWNRQIRILRKIGEYPQAYNDADAEVFLVNSYAAIGGITETYDDTGLLQGQIYYYALFAENLSGSWIHDWRLDRDSAYPYARWGSAEYLFKSMPFGWQKADSEGSGHLEDFLTIFGALCDNIKTDAENLGSLFEINSIHADLIEYLDDKIAWPTWYSAGGLQRRKDTAKAVDLYKLIGTESAYVQLLEGVSDWDAEVDEGWRFIMWSNNKFSSTTPDTTDPNLLPNVGLTSDLLKYTVDNDSWHSLSGLLFTMSEIPGVSGPFTSEMISRYHELIDFSKATFVNYQLVLVPSNEELFDMATRVSDEWNIGMDTVTRYESVDSVLETDLGATTSSVSLFESWGPAVAYVSLTNDVDYRTYHSALAYV
jgi:hypothetical protein